MRLAVAVLWGTLCVYGQTCAPLRILPSAVTVGTLDGSSCLLSDGTAYQAYRLVLPDRGLIQITMGGTTNSLALILRDGDGRKVASGSALQQPVEAGTYLLLVDGQTPGQVGGYSVQTAFTAEPGMQCANFDSIGLNDAAEGVLGASGCALPSGTVYEAYSLNTLGSGMLTISITSPDFTPTVIVRQSDGTAAAEGAAVQVVPVYANTAYQILVSTADTSGTYQIHTSFQPADGETCVPQANFPASGSDSATVGTSNCTGAADDGSLLYFTYYNLTVTAPGLANLTVSSSDFQPALYLLDQSGNAITSDGGGAIQTQLGPGNYLVEVASAVASGGAYTFNYQFTAGPPQPCAQASAALGSQIAGTLTPASCRDNDLGLTGLYSITLPADGTLDVLLGSSDFNGQLALRDSKDNRILAASTELLTDLPAGTYTIVASAVSGIGAYTLLANLTAHPITPCTYVQPMDNNGGYIADLGQGSCKGPNGQPLDFFQFTLPADGVVLAVMTSSQVDGHLSLTDASGAVLRSDEDSYAPNDPLIIQYLPAGTYQLQARAASATAGGLYEVDVRTTAGPRPPFCTPQTGLSVGATVNAALGYTSCQYADATFADIYSFTLSAATSIDLELAATAFTPYLLLLDGDGNVLASGASIQQSLSPGNYFAVAKAEPYSGYYASVGSYTLSLAKGQ